MCICIEFAVLLLKIPHRVSRPARLYVLVYEHKSQQVPGEVKSFEK